MSHLVDRRRFLKTLGAAVTAGAALDGCSSRSSRSGARRRTSDIKITSVEAYELDARRWKVVGKNSRLDRHGDVARERILRIRTDAGVEGVAHSWADREQAARLLGEDPLSFYTAGAGIASPLGDQDAPLWDLVGKLEEKPVWKLLGGAGSEWIPVYDGSIYFADLMPEHAGRGIDRILEEVDHAAAAGHRAFKIKIGRGAKWMAATAGFKRDVEVVRAIRKRLGAGFRLMVDANNGFDLATTKRFLEEAGDEFYFVEEMFEERVEEDLELKSFLRERGWKTRVADGESAARVEHFTPFVEARAIDVVQADIRRFGFSELARLSALTAPAGLTLAPHNWGSFLGLYMQAMLGRGVPNFLIAEMDPATTDAFDATAFEFREGKVRVPDLPGCGLPVRPAVFDAAARRRWQAS